MKIALVFFALFFAALSSQQASAQDDRLRANKTNKYVTMDVPGTQSWHFQSDATLLLTMDKAVLIAPAIEEMGSVELQVLYGGFQECPYAGGKGFKCDKWDVSWVWINHLKAGPVPLDCQLSIDPSGSNAGDFAENTRLFKEFTHITPGKGEQEKQYSFSTYHTVDYANPHNTSWSNIFTGVVCSPPDPDNAHHKCREGETTGCMLSPKSPKPGQKAVKNKAAPSS